MMHLISHYRALVQSRHGIGAGTWTGRIFVIGVALMLQGMVSVLAGTVPPVKVRWNASLEAGVSGYELRYGTASGRYTKVLNAGKNTRVSVPGLKEGETYYFAVFAYNNDGLKSLPSPEAKYRAKAPDSNRPPNGMILSPSLGGTIVAGQSVVFSGKGSDPDDNNPLSYRWSFGQGSGIRDATSKNPGKRCFQIPGTYRVTFTVTDSKGKEDPKPSSRTITVVAPQGNGVSRSGWKLVFVNSEQSGGFAATSSFDGDPETFWRTRRKTSSLPKSPHEIQIDMGKPLPVNGFKYLPRQDNSSIGGIARFKFYVSSNPRKWGKAVATGKFSSSKAGKQVFFAPKTGRYIRLVSLSEVNGNSECSVAELSVFESKTVNRRPVAKPMWVRTAKNRAVKLRLKGRDPDANPLTFRIMRKPKHGSLRGNPPRLTYKPRKGFAGIDRFTYRVSDGFSKSRSVTVKIKVSQSRPSPASAPLAGFALAEPTGEAPASARIGCKWIAGEKYLTLTAPKSSPSRGSGLIVQVSSNLVDWYSGNRHTTVLTDNGRFLKVRDNTPVSATRKRYIRLKPARP